MFLSIQPWNLQFKNRKKIHFCCFFCWLFRVQIRNIGVLECKHANKKNATWPGQSTFYSDVENAVDFFWSSFFSICSAGEIVSFPFSVYCFYIVSRWLSEYARKVSEMWWSFFLFFNNWCLSIKYYYHLTDIPSIFAIYVFLFVFSFLSLNFTLLATTKQFDVSSFLILIGYA